MIKQKIINEFINKPLFLNRENSDQDNWLPTISIVTPSYNQGKYLEKTIRSVLNQNYPNLEYIIIDGGSTDNSVDIIKKYERHIAYWVSEKDSGQAAAINKGFAKSSGEIFAWLNSDDIYLPGALRSIAYHYQNNTDSGFYYGHCILLDQDDHITNYLFTCEMDAALYMFGANLFQGAVFWKRELFLKYGCLDENLHYAMEYKLFDDFFRYEKHKYINRALAGLRIHDKSKSSLIYEVGRKEMYNLRGNIYLPKSTQIYYKLKRYFLMLMDGNLHNKIFTKIRSILFR